MSGTSFSEPPTRTEETWRYPGVTAYYGRGGPPRRHPLGTWVQEESGGLLPFIMLLSQVLCELRLRSCDTLRGVPSLLCGTVPPWPSHGRGPVENGKIPVAEQQTL